MKLFFLITGIGLLSVLSYAPMSDATETEARVTIVPASSEEAQHEEDVFIFLQSYFSALANGEVAMLATYHPSLTAEQLELLSDYFAHTVRDLHIRLENVHVRMAAKSATVTFYRTDQFLDRSTGKSVKRGVELSTTLVHGSNGWRVARSDQILPQQPTSLGKPMLVREISEPHSGVKKARSSIQFEKQQGGVHVLENFRLPMYNYEEQPTLSVIVPVYNEVVTIREILKRMNCPHPVLEIVFIALLDCSPALTFQHVMDRVSFLRGE